jgi:signal transduction histidine kinase
MKKRLRIITIALSLSIILMAALSYFSIDRFGSLINYSSSVDHTNKVIGELYILEGLVKDLDRVERGYMLTKDTTYQKGLFNLVQKISPVVDSLKALTSDNPEEEKNLVLVKSALTMRLDFLKDNFAYIDTSVGSAISPSYYQGHNMTQDCMKTIKEMQTEENRLMEVRQRNKNFYQKLTSASLKTILATFCLITLVSFVLILRELKKRIASQEDLQAKILDLKHSHSELEQIAYAASHDLQEPLRKIQVFSNRLAWLKNEHIDDESKHTMERISMAATRMQELIDDLVNLTSLTKQSREKTSVDLNLSVKHAISELQDRISEKNAKITIDQLPSISAHADQMQILFKALLDNSIKFSRDGVPPVITIKSSIVINEESNAKNNFARKRYYRIDVSDNGIGFDNKFSHKLFQMFQRLHNQQSEYHGKGIGLSLCQRIMANHNGFIEAHGHYKTGATFKLFFPETG